MKSFGRKGGFLFSSSPKGVGRGGEKKKKGSVKGGGLIFCVWKGLRFLVKDQGRNFELFQFFNEMRSSISLLAVN